jgi:hypothetical protein
MLEAMQATIAHANENDNIEYYKTKEGALDYIGTRINAGAMSKEKRIQAAKNVFHKEILPHIGIEISDAKAKGYFFGYMCNKLLSCALNRSTSDERDHFANKRCDLAGPLLGSLFKLSLKRLIKNMRKEVQSKLDKDYTIDMYVLCSLSTLSKVLDIHAGNPSSTTRRLLKTSLVASLPAIGQWARMLRLVWPRRLVSRKFYRGSHSLQRLAISGGLTLLSAATAKWPHLASFITLRSVSVHVLSCHSC